MSTSPSPTTPAQPAYICAEYVWLSPSLQTTIEGTPSQELYPRSKSRTFTQHFATSPPAASDLPDWNFDGSSTNQAEGKDSEVIMKPVKVWHDPFRGAPHILVLCDLYNAQTNKPLPSNTRHPANAKFQAAMDEEPWYGIEQEYTLKDAHNGNLLGWPKDIQHLMREQGHYYCGVGADRSFGRKISDEHYKLCLEMGLTISGTNAEVMAGQWEFQVGPVTGIAAGDELWMARYILHRICEKQGVIADFHPKPIQGAWNGSGAHTNFSTASMRAKGGYPVIEKAIKKLGDKHLEHIEVYGLDNDMRMTGTHETSDLNKFSYGVANRGASIRIPRTTHADNCGYFEDRRPASNMDPYIVSAKIFDTCCLN